MPTDFKGTYYLKYQNNENLKINLSKIIRTIINNSSKTKKYLIHKGTYLWSQNVYSSRKSRGDHLRAI